MNYAMKNISVLVLTVVSLVCISGLTKHNVDAIHNGIRPVITYTPANLDYTIANHTAAVVKGY